MRKFKKFVAAGLTAAMAVSLVACTGNGGSTTNNSTEATKESGEDAGIKPYEQTRDINLGTWYEIYYTSDHEDIYANPKMDKPEIAQMQVDNVKAIEEKYNVKLHVKNLTWEGIMNSINTSITAGTPDCDAYLTDLQFGVPAVLNEYAMPISSFASADDDVFNDQVVMKYLNVLGMDESYLFGANATNTDAYMLGFNMDAIEQAGLENPQDLYDKGEWTWDKFYEYIKALTVDTDGDGKMNQYGYSGWWTTFFANMMLTNDAQIAAETTEGLSSPAVLETIEFIDKIYHDGYARPWNADDWDDNVKSCASGSAVFWTTAHWVQQQWFINEETGETPFKIGMVPFPVGPNGEGKDIATRTETSSLYFIPVGTKDANVVYKVMFDWFNWYNYDIELRDDTEWAENQMTAGTDADQSARNFEYLKKASAKAKLELYDKLNIDIGLYNIVVQDGSTTPSQLVEAHSSEIQAALDAYIGK